MLAILSACATDVGASAAGVRVKRGLAMQESVREPAYGGAIGKQRLMLARSMGGPQVQAVNYCA